MFYLLSRLEKFRHIFNPMLEKRYIPYSSVTSGNGLTEERIDQEEKIAALISSSEMFLNPLKS